MEQILALVLGGFASWIQGDFLKDLNLSDEWVKRVRYGVSMLACVVVGFVVQYLNSSQSGTSWDWNDALLNIGAAFTASQTYYNAYFRLK